MFSRWSAESAVSKTERGSEKVIWSRCRRCIDPSARSKMLKIRFPTRPRMSPSQGRESLPLKKVTSVESRLAAVRKFRPLKSIAGDLPVVECAAVRYCRRKVLMHACNSSKVFGEPARIAVFSVLGLSVGRRMPRRSEDAAAADRTEPRLQ